MSAKIIQHLYMAGTYIVSKYNGSEFKHIKTVHQNKKTGFLHICFVSMATAAILMMPYPTALFNVVVNIMV